MLKKYKGKTLDEMNFQEVDDALYLLESPFYAACAGGTHFTVTKEWEIERLKLRDKWTELCPYGHNKEKEKISIFETIKKAFK